MILSCYGSCDILLIISGVILHYILNQLCLVSVKHLPEFVGLILPVGAYAVAPERSIRGHCFAVGIKYCHAVHIESICKLLHKLLCKLLRRYMLSYICSELRLCQVLCLIFFSFLSQSVVVFGQCLQHFSSAPVVGYRLSGKCEKCLCVKGHNKSKYCSAGRHA